MPMPNIFSGTDDSGQMNITKMFANLERPSVCARPKPSNVQNPNTKNQAEKHVSHSNF